MHHHHDMEEQGFFPSIERLSGVEGLMAQNYEQHKAFTPGFEDFDKYVRSTNPSEYDGMMVRQLVEAFAEPLTKHLHEEIDTLRALNKYDSKEVREAYKRFEKSMMSTDNVTRHPDPKLASRMTDAFVVPRWPSRLRNR